MTKIGRTARLALWTFVFVFVASQLALFTYNFTLMTLLGNGTMIMCNNVYGEMWWEMGFLITGWIISAPLLILWLLRKLDDALGGVVS